LGAALLMQLCIDQPKRVKKAILCGGPAVVPITAKLQVESLRYALEHNFSQDYISLTNVPWLFGRRFLEDKKRLKQWNAKLMANQYPQTFSGFQAQAQVVLNFDLSSRLKEITTECLIMASDEDLIIPMHCMQFLKKHIRNSKLEIISEGIGHMFHVEEPQQLSELALSFFKKF
jgi:pimeloyl-ACP methyl ester carboxylesterase